MKWRHKPEPQHRPGDYRTIKFFLWLPRTIEPDTRWMERATIKQVLVRRRLGSQMPGGYATDTEAWLDCEWVDHDRP